MTQYKKNCPPEIANDQNCLIFYGNLKGKNPPQCHLCFLPGKYIAGLINKVGPVIQTLDLITPINTWPQKTHGSFTFFSKPLSFGAARYIFTQTLQVWENPGVFWTALRRRQPRAVTLWSFGSFTFDRLSLNGQTKFLQLIHGIFGLLLANPKRTFFQVPKKIGGQRCIEKAVWKGVVSAFVELFQHLSKWCFLRVRKNLRTLFLAIFEGVRFSQERCVFQFVLKLFFGSLDVSIHWITKTHIIHPLDQRKSQTQYIFIMTRKDLCMYLSIEKTS